MRTRLRLHPDALRRQSGAQADPVALDQRIYVVMPTDGNGDDVAGVRGVPVLCPYVHGDGTRARLRDVVGVGAGTGRVDLD